MTSAPSLASCRIFDSGRVDSTALAHDDRGAILRVTVLGRSGDPRIATVREAIDYWNRELLRLGRRVRMDSVIIRNDSVPDDVLRAASAEVWLGFGPRISRLYSALRTTPGDIVIALSRTDLISFSLHWKTGKQGVVGIRRADVWPLSLPNTLRNVTAHELGHVFGLDHNGDATTLMCGRPAHCRPADFASDSVRFFPLTPTDEQWLRKRWP